MILSDPFEALAWARQFARRARIGSPKRRIRVSGKPYRGQMANAGDSVRIEIEALGSLEIAVSG